MSFLSIGDLAQSFQFRRDTARVSSEIRTLSAELSSGRVSDPARAVSGDIAPLAAITRDLSELGARERTLSEAALAGTVSDQVLARISDDTETLSASLLLIRTAGQPALVDAAARDARQRFSAAIAGLNSQAAGRSLFAGQAFDRPALADAETILADLLAAVSASTDPAATEAAVDAWFAPGGGFETGAYLGSPARETPVRLGDGATAEPTLLATDPRITETLAELARAALLDLGLFAGQGDFRAELAAAAGEGLVDAKARLVDARAAIGVAAGEIEDARARIASERGALELARSEMVSADPYETASRLRDAEARLETLYVLTGRLADLSLTRYLR